MGSELMQPIFLDDPAWLSTFPHLVAPLPDEWLYGLLLRCDELNAWGSEATLMYWLRSTRGRYGTAMSNFAVGTFFHMGFLARLLGLSERDLFATTYYLELAHLYNTVQPFFQQLMLQLQFQCCPICLTQRRLMRRAFTLPQITACPVHRVMLLKQCPCGRSLRSWTRLETPFICGSCNTNWEDFPHIAVQEGQCLFEERCLTYYEFFFSQGTPTHLECARYLILKRARERRVSTVRHNYDRRGFTRMFYFDLGRETGPRNNLEKLLLCHLIDLLVALDISPEDIMMGVNAGDKFD
jgi:TniQ